MRRPAYPKYKATDVEWLGAVPEGWELKQLKWAVMFQRGHDLPSDEREEGDVPLVSSSGVSSTQARAVAKGPGIVTGRYGTIGQFYLIQDDYWPLNTTLYSIDLRGNDPRFLRYMLTHLSPLFLLNAVKSAVPGVDRNDIHHTRTAIPRLPEQHAIADFLDRKTQAIDELIRKKERLIELLQEKRQALIHEAMQLEDTRSIRLGAVADRVCRPINRQDEEVYTPVGLFNRGRGIFHKEPTRGAELGDSTFFWIEEGDLILSGQFAWEGSVALAGREDARCVATHRYPIFRARTEQAETAYLLAFFKTPRGQFLLCEHSRGAAGRNRPLNAGTLMKEKIPVPPIHEQQRIATLVHLEARLADVIARQFERLREYRQALISAAVTGQIDVTERVAA